MAGASVAEDCETIATPTRKKHTSHPSVVRLTFLYIISEAVIPAKAGIQFRNAGFRVKPGMTNKVKGLLTQYTRHLFMVLLLSLKLIFTYPKSIVASTFPLIDGFAC
jgi:hypothetical protein